MKRTNSKDAMNAQINALVSQYLTTKDSKVLGQITQCCESFIAKKAWRKQPDGALDVQDLIQEGQEVLLLLIDSYNPADGQDFLEYISIPIQRRLSQVMNDQGSTVSRPLYSREDIYINSLDEDDEEEDEDKLPRYESHEELLVEQPDLEPDERFLKLQEAMQVLNPDELGIIRMVIRPNNYEDEEIAQQMGLKVSYVRRVRHSATRKMYVYVHQK